MTTQRTRTAVAAMALVLAGGSPVLGQQTATAASTESQMVAASAGTLVYVKDHNVWISRPDGSGQRQVTADGTASWPYFSPSMADDGTIAAGHDGQIVRMRQGGTPLNRFTPRALKGSLTNLGQVAIAPNSVKIAYSMVNTGCTGTGCSTATGYTASDRATDPETDGSTYFKMPSWAGSSRTLQSGGSGSEVMVHDLGGGAVHWFDTQGGITDVELSPDGLRLAGAAGYQGNDGISTYDADRDVTSGPVPLPPDHRCTWDDDDGGALVSPTWGPDSRALAFQADDGVWVADDVTVGCDAVSFHLLIPGASAPDWSAATYNPEPVGTQHGTFTATTAPKVKGKAKVGKVLKAKAGAWSPAPTAVSYQWLRNGKPIKKAKKASYRVTRKDRGKRISVRLTISRPGLTSATWTSAPKKVKR
ncbi:hypothetical protein QI633_21145 [Nocardioides sp. QY071]|uniref:hypothetical protein n=1 Tax=Nocardioides sp. QY071 TaxID=3044187 RepID=UPI00249CEB06|nr:hypothetical protein [Nocardioides sp. QY071]WGY01034.1 hypothetical protein QI633_21145 [Nocardioides sp. QY071]